MIELRIEELVLEGWAPGDRRAIVAAAERELAGLLASAGAAHVGARDATVPRLDGGTLQLPAGAGARAIGIEIARAVHRSVGSLQR